MLRPRIRHWPLWIICGLVIALAIWARPRRIEGLATLDGRQQWLTDRNAPARQFAWQPGEELSGLLPAHDPPDEIGHPFLADDGRTLYLTVRRAGGDADIYRSQSLDGRWQPAQAVTELNTPWDEIGVAVSADGRQLYLASNRRGGKGGFDIYVSQRRATGWGVPKGLGEAINSPGDEFDPAISSDGSQLYFAKSPSAEEATDLYVATREAMSKAWREATPVVRVNSAGNEQSPCLGDSGAMLYFASDRPRRSGERNFDLYRLRLNDPRAVAESLGRGINTPADETNPAISPDGFNLIFTRAATDSPAVCHSRLVEVQPITVWDNSRWHVLRAVWWKAALAAALSLGLLAGVYYGVGWLRRPASMGRFLAASLLVHVVVLWLLVLVPLSREIVRRVEEIRVSQEARELFDDNLHQSHEPGEQAYEKVADLKSVETVETPPIARQTVASTNVPLHAEKLAPTLPPEVARRLPADRVVFVPPEITPLKQTPDIARRAEPATRLAAVEPLIAEPPEEVKLPEDKPVEEKVELKRVAAAMMAPAEPADRVRPLAEIVVQAPALTPVDADIRLAQNADRPPPRPIGQAAPAAVIEQEAVALTAVERANEQAVLGAARAAVTVAAKESAGPMPSDEITGRPVTPAKIAAHALSPESAPPASPAPPPSIRRSTSGPASLAQTTDEEPLVLAKVVAAQEQAAAPAKVELPVAAPTAPAPASDSLVSGGPRQADKRELVLGTLAKRAVEAPPSLNPLASQLQRPAARATPVAFAEDNVGMQAMFALRQGDTRREFIDLVGGNVETEAAVKRGLVWLVEHQYADGHWSLHQLDPPEKKLPATSGAGGIASDTAATGLGLLPFLGSGHTHLAGEYQPVVTKAVSWLVERQKPDGNLFTDAPSNAFMYSHGIASIALCEAYGLSQDERLRDPAQRALNFIVAAQHAGTGGWRYRPGEPGDTSVVGWQVMALKSGEMAGLDVPKASLELANKWLTSAAGTGGSLGTFGYQGPGGSPAMTAEGLLCRQFLGTRRNDPFLLAGANFLLQHLPQAGAESSYYWYYATQVMYHMQGDYWTAWNERLRDLLVSTQIKDGHQSGTWDPRDGWEQSGGRLYATSLRLLMLEVYYRHLPLYQQWE